MRGSAKTAAGASVSGKLHDAPARSSENDFADASQPLETNEVTSASEVGREARDSNPRSGHEASQRHNPPLSAPSLAEATAELRDAQHALDKAISFWWQHSPEDGAAIARRWWTAREVFRDAIAGES